MQFEAVFFDLDGTLANSLFDLTDGINITMKHFGFPSRTTEEVMSFVGDGILKTILRSIPAEKLESVDLKKAEEVFLNYYSKHYADKTIAYNGMVDLVKHIKSKGIKIAVVTNKEQKMAEKVVEKVYGNIFDCVLGMSEGIPPKPDPTGVLLVAKKLGVQPQKTAFVGDTGIDIATGINAGTFPIGVLWGYRKQSEMEELGVKTFAKNSKELSQIILGGY